MSTELDEMTQTQTEDSSGRWIRDQLRDVAEEDDANLEQAAAEALNQEPTEEPQPQPAGEQEIYANLAQNISQAVLAPIQGLEQRRATELKDLESKLERAIERVDRIEDTVGSSERRSEEAARRIDGIESGLRHDADELSASIVQLKDSLEKLNGDVEGVNEKVKSQGETVDGLKRLEGRRRDSLQRISQAAAELQAAVQQLSEDSSEGVWVGEPAADGAFDSNDQ